MKVQLLVQLNEDGSVSVSGPIENKVLCYGLMEMARDAIKTFNDKKSEQKIVPATLLPNGALAERIGRA